MFYKIVILLGAVLLSAGAQAQRKTIAELTLVYDYSAGPADKDKPEGTAGAAGTSGSANTASAVHTIYIKGNMSRSEMTNALFSSTTIFDGNTGFGVILKEVSGQKLLIRMNPDDWSDKNRMYDDIVFTSTNETKDIAGYSCVKAIGQTRTGTTITVYYTKNLVPETKQYDPIFRTLDGLPLEYELSNGKVKIHYRVSSISFNPVPASKFDIPSSGFREMSYEESKKMKIGG
jgi:GLPGLI family protein